MSGVATMDRGATVRFVARGLKALARHALFVISDNPVTAYPSVSFCTPAGHRVSRSVDRAHDAFASNTAGALQKPSLHHLFGTGPARPRHLQSRVLVATRPDIAIALSSVALVFALGGVAGIAAGYFGGWTDRIVGRVSDTIMAFPLFVLAMGIVAALENTVTNIVIAPRSSTFRSMRASRAPERTSGAKPGYIQAARLCGNSDARILFGTDPAQHPSDHDGADVADHGLRHPQCRRPVVHRPGRAAADAGMGIMVAEGASFIASGRMVDRHFPGLALMLAVFCFNLLGDGLRDIVDPQRPDLEATMSNPPLLEIEDSRSSSATRRGVVAQSSRVLLEVGKGETVALVGESAPGKSVTSYAGMGISTATAGSPGPSSIPVCDLDEFSERECGTCAVAECPMIFQNPRRAQSDPTGRPADRRRADPPRCATSRDAKKAIEAFGEEGDNAARALSRLSVRTVRRHAPAHRHCPGARLSPACRSPTS